MKRFWIGLYVTVGLFVAAAVYAPQVLLNKTVMAKWLAMSAAQAQTIGQVQVGPDAALLGKVFAQGALPTATNGTVTVGSTSFRGSATVTAGGTALVITFAAAFISTPFCMLDSPSNSLKAGRTISTASITIPASALSTGDVITYICIGIN